MPRCKVLLMLLMLLWASAACQAEGVSLPCGRENAMAAPVACVAEPTAMGWQGGATTGGAGRYNRLTTGDQRNNDHGRDAVYDLSYQGGLSNMFGRAMVNAQAPSLDGTEPQAAGAATPWRQGAYFWDSRQLLDAQTRAGALDALQSVGIRRIHLGLSSAQLSRPEWLDTELRGLLAQARESGMETTLLLGDPHWMLPGPRQHLIELIGQLSTLPFATLHLDLEVEQLGWPVPQSRLQDWMDTLAEVTRVSPWPVEISSHHRWFAAPEPEGYCVPCALQERGVRQVSLMIYTRSPERSIELTEGIAQRWPDLSFRLAQSVEPQLAPYETWSGVPHEQLQEQVEQWRQRLQPLSVTGIDWQAWSFYPVEP